MKTAIMFGMMAFLILMGCSKADNESLNANANQVKSAPQNGTVSYYWTGGYFTPLICGGVEIDYLSGNVDWHIRDHYKDGEIVWTIYNATGNLTSANTGEVFDINESDKVNVAAGEYTFHSNIIGNQGSHYILSGTGLLYYPWTVTVEKAVCPAQ